MHAPVHHHSNPLGNSKALDAKANTALTLPPYYLAACAGALTPVVHTHALSQPAGHLWENAGCFYSGGTLEARASDGKLVYYSGRAGRDTRRSVSLTYLAVGSGFYYPIRKLVISPATTDSLGDQLSVCPRSLQLMLHPSSKAQSPLKSSHGAHRQTVSRGTTQLGQSSPPGRTRSCSSYIQSHRRCNACIWVLRHGSTPTCS